MGVRMTSLAKLIGITDAQIQRLEAADVHKTETLLKRGSTPDGRKELAKATRISLSRVTDWVHRAVPAHGAQRLVSRPVGSCLPPRHRGAQHVPGATGLAVFARVGSRQRSDALGALAAQQQPDQHLDAG